MIHNNPKFVALIFCMALLLTQCQKKAEGPIEYKFFNVTISPDGQWVAWIQQPFNPSSLELISGKTVYIQELSKKDATPRCIATNGMEMKADDSLSWSPDSTKLAFFSDESGKAQLYLANAKDGSKQNITKLDGYLADIHWSPDGKSIALLYTEYASRTPGAINAGKRQIGVIGEKINEQRLTIVDVANGDAHQISPKGMYIYEYDWSPDNQSFALIASHGEGDANWWIAGLYLLSLVSKEMTELYHPPYQVATPRWSPDGSQIAFIGGLMSDQIYVGGNIYTIPAKGGQVTDLTPGITTSPNHLHWLNTHTIIFSEYIDGLNGISSLDTTTKKITSLWQGSEVILTKPHIPGISLSINGEKSAIIKESYATPPEIWVGSIGQWRQLTHANDAIHPKLGEMKSIHWMNGNLKIQGWLLYPVDYNPDHCYPMLVNPHGGPAAQQGLSYGGQFMNDLSARGYFIFFPNSRGSFGQGENFTQSNIKDWGYGDFSDIMTGIDEIVKILPIDKKRIGIFGWSYGGYLSIWAVTQTNRFRAASAGAALSDFQSYYGQNKISEWLIPYFGASVYDDPPIYARSSPITFIKNAKTPTLLLAGEYDEESPAVQSLEFWHALKTLGVHTELVIYPDEGHRFIKPEHQRDARERTIKWFDHYLKPESKICQ